MQIEDNPTLDDRKQFYLQSIKDHFSTNRYQEIFKDLEFEEENIVFPINLDNIRKDNKHLYQEIIKNPTELISYIEEYLITKIKEITMQDEESIDDPKLRLTFSGSLAQQTVTPRGLKSNMVNKLIKLNGIVTYSSKAKVRLLKSTHYCEANSKFVHKVYNDLFNLRINNDNSSSNLNDIPLFDKDNLPLTFEHGLSEFKDFQVLGVQETPENVPTGLLSRSVEVFLQEDIVDATKPGDRVQIIGILKPVNTSNTFAKGVFKPVLIAYSVISLTDSDQNLDITVKDKKRFEVICKRPDLLELFKRSLAPSIFGHDDIKQALLLMLLGGNEVITDNGSKIRGDINIMLIGDPSTGKSQFLRRIMQVAPLSFNTTGRGSTGVGLTAAVIFDRDSGEKRLEAGAMVLADRGIICIDEFDKMNPEDRVAMHEVMEQQTVTIAKAGIHISLNARCSVLAAANPIYGEYMTNKSPSFNIGMRDTLLSRFDLIFIVLDENDEGMDRLLAEKVTNNHRFIGEGVDNLYNDGTGLVEDKVLDNEDKNNDDKVFQQYNGLLHEDKNTEYLTQDFLKKYICYAKQKRNNPEMTEEATEYISSKWAELRRIEKERQKLTIIMPISIRSLESMIRISTALAKLRLSKKVEKRDVVQCLVLYMKAFYGGYEEIDTNFFKHEEHLLVFGKSVKKKRNMKKKSVKRKSVSKKKKNKKKQNPEIILPEVKKIAKKIDKVEKEKVKFVWKCLILLKGKKESDMFEIEELYKFVLEENKKDALFLDFENKQELYAILAELEKTDKIMVEKDVIYVI